MMNKFSVAKGFVAAVFVGITLSCAPVQAGCGKTCIEGVAKAFFKEVRMYVSGCLVVCGSTFIGKTLVYFGKDLNVGKDLNGRAMQIMGQEFAFGLSAVVLGSIFLFRELRSGNQSVVDRINLKKKMRIKL